MKLPGDSFLTIAIGFRISEPSTVPNTKLQTHGGKPPKEPLVVDSDQKFPSYFPIWAQKGCLYIFSSMTHDPWQSFRRWREHLGPKVPKVEAKMVASATILASESISQKINKNLQFWTFLNKESSHNELMKTHFFLGRTVGGGIMATFHRFSSKVNWAVTAATPGRVIQRWRVKATTSTVNHSFLASHWVVAIYLQWMALLPMWWLGFLNGKTLGVRWCETGRELFLFSERLVYLRIPENCNYLQVPRHSFGAEGLRFFGGMRWVGAPGSLLVV